MSATEPLNLRIRRSNADGRAALIGYWPVGYPDLQTSILVMHAMVDGGCDIIEAGIPHPNPTLDGPVIREAGRIALQNGFRAMDTISAVNTLRTRDVEVLIMGYWDSFSSVGVELFAERMSLVRASGAIIPDMTSIERSFWTSVSEHNSLANVSLLNSRMSDECIEYMASGSSGFLYAAASNGVTGAAGVIDGTSNSFVSRIRKASSLPICLGIGISDTARASKAASIADGVIIGSELIRRFNRNPGYLGRSISEVKSFVSELSEAMTYETSVRHSLAS